MKNIFVGSLSFRTTEDAIRAVFQEHGTVERVSMVIDRDTGQSRGFCFVEIANDAEAQRAIVAINGKEVYGRNAQRQRGSPENRSCEWWSPRVPLVKGLA